MFYLVHLKQIFEIFRILLFCPFLQETNKYSLVIFYFLVVNYSVLRIRLDLFLRSIYYIRSDSHTLNMFAKLKSHFVLMQIASVHMPQLRKSSI